MQCLLPSSKHFSQPSCRSYGTCWFSPSWLLALSLCLLATLGSAGCVSGKKVILVPEADALLRAGPDLIGRVYVWNGAAWELSANPVHIPEGWYVGTFDETPQDSAPDGAAHGRQLRN